MFQLSPNSIFLLAIVLGLAVGLPSVIIESIWNGSVASTFTERDLTINVFKASLLWGAILTTIYMSGIFKIQIDFKKLDNLDINDIEDPDLKDEIKKLKEEYKTEKEKTGEIKNSDDFLKAFNEVIKETKKKEKDSETEL